MFKFVHEIAASLIRWANSNVITIVTKLIEILPSEFVCGYVLIVPLKNCGVGHWGRLLKSPTLEYG
jgi:hypothetical protein